MSALPDDYKDRLLAAVDMIHRMGAKSFEVGYLHDDVPMEEAAWWAKASFKGAVVFAEEMPGPVEAAEALRDRLSDGAACRWCLKRISWGPWIGDTRCAWKMVNGRWEPGCVPVGTSGPPPNQELTFMDMGVVERTGNESADLPAKVPGQHRWIVTAVYTVSEDDAKEMAGGPGDTMILLNDRNRLGTTVGCVDCEQELHAALGKPCPGDPSGETFEWNR